MLKSTGNTNLRTYNKLVELYSAVKVNIGGTSFCKGCALMLNCTYEVELGHRLSAAYLKSAFATGRNVIGVANGLKSLFTFVVNVVVIFVIRINLV